MPLSRDDLGQVEKLILLGWWLGQGEPVNVTALRLDHPRDVIEAVGEVLPVVEATSSVGETLLFVNEYDAVSVPVRGATAPQVQVLTGWMVAVQGWISPAALARWVGRGEEWCRDLLVSAATVLPLVDDERGWWTLDTLLELEACNDERGGDDG